MTTPLTREQLDRYTSFAHADDGERAALYALLDAAEKTAAALEVAVRERGEWRARAEGLQVLVDSAAAARDRARVTGINTGVAVAESALAEALADVARLTTELDAARKDIETVMHGAIREAEALHFRAAVEACVAEVQKPGWGHTELVWALRRLVPPAPTETRGPLSPQRAEPEAPTTEAEPPVKHYCMRCEPCLDEIRDLKRRATLARRYLKCVSSGQFVTGALVVAALRTLDTKEPLPLRPLPKRKGR